MEGIIRSNRNFHYTMYEAANMPILQQVITGLWDQWAPYLYLSLGRNLALHKHDSDGSLKVHQGIMEGMKRRDSAMVRTLLKQDFAEYITLTKISLNILTDIISVI